MTAGPEFRDAYRRALADLHRGQRTRRGRQTKPRASARFGNLGYRREPPCEHDQECRCEWHRNSTAHNSVIGDVS